METTTIKIGTISPYAIDTTKSFSFTGELLSDFLEFFSLNSGMVYNIYRLPDNRIFAHLLYWVDDITQSGYKIYSDFDSFLSVKNYPEKVRQDVRRNYENKQTVF